MGARRPYPNSTVEVSPSSHTFRLDAVASAVNALIEHSHTIATLHPSARSAASVSRSLQTFDSNFAAQKPSFVAGEVVYRHPGWRCQKQPWTCTTAPNLGKTMSGRPGSSLSWRRNRSPRRCSALRRATSGLVFRPRIPDIIRDRVALSTTSTMFSWTSSKLLVSVRINEYSVQWPGRFMW